MENERKRYMEGRVISINGGMYEVLDSLSGNVVVCRCSGRLRYAKIAKDSPFNFSSNSLSKKTSTNTVKLSPKVGDIVEYSNELDLGLITSVNIRTNEMIRPDIANVDQILLVFAAKKPEFSFYLLDIFLTNIEKEEIKPLIVVTKKDLLTDSEFEILKTKLSYYEKIGYNVFYVNNKTGEGIDQVAEMLKGKITVLAGQTGAGKSSFINAIIPGFKLNTQEISEALGRGKHTTRVVSLYQYFDGFIGDTPGFSKLDLSNISKNDLANYFVEFKNYKCKFKNCQHDASSVGCSIKDNKDILDSRKESYQKIINETGRKK